MDHVAAWLPRVLPGIALLCNGLQGDDFDAAMAVLWALAAWSVGTMVRLLRMYPFKSPTDLSVKACLERVGMTRWHGIPVEWKGKLLVGESVKGAKPAVRFSDGTADIAVNQIVWSDFAPRFFGVSDLPRLADGEVTLKGWFRGGASPFVEISEIRTDKTKRKSLVRMLRWVFAILVLRDCDPHHYFRMKHSPKEFIPKLLKGFADAMAQTRLRSRAQKSACS